MINMKPEELDLSFQINLEQCKSILSELQTGMNMNEIALFQRNTFVMLGFKLKYDLFCLKSVLTGYGSKYLASFIDSKKFDEDEDGRFYALVGYGWSDHL